MPAAKATLTPEQLDLIQKAVRQTWRYIAPDLIEANGGNDMPKSHVVECVLDCDRLESDARNPAEREAIAAFRALPHPKQNKIAGDALGPYKRFG